MNDSPNRWRAIAAFTILASALSFTLAGCTNKTSPASRPRKLRPPRAGANPSTAANTAPVPIPRTLAIQRAAQSSTAQNPHQRPNPPWSFPAALVCRCV